MNWLVYWFMFPVCIVIASVAIFSGISGAALLTPFFMIGFPLMGMPHLTPVQAIGTSLFLETSGFGMGVYRYLKLKLADIRTVKSLIVLTLPAGIIGAIVSHTAPSQVLHIGYGFAMLVVSYMLIKSKSSGKHAHEAGPCLVSESECATTKCPADKQRKIKTSSGKIFIFCVSGMKLQKVMSTVGAFIAGLISTGVGEATLPTLVRRSRFPVPVAAATSTMVVAATVLGAATTHFIELFLSGGLRAIPWNLIVWSVPGAFIGASLGSHFQGRVSEKMSRIFFSILFFFIGIAFLITFTFFSQQFGK